MHSRRDVLKGLMIAGAAAVTPTAAASAMASSPRPADSKAPSAPLPAAPAAPAAPWGLLAPLAVGSVVGLGWQVRSLSPVVDGASVLVLEQPDGRQARVHLCRNDGTARGPAHSRHVDLMVMNGGRGDQVTEESLGRVVIGLADLIRGNEETPERPAMTAAMLTHDERIRRFGTLDSAALA